MRKWLGLDAVRTLFATVSAMLAVAILPPNPVWIYVPVWAARLATTIFGLTYPFLVDRLGA